MFSEPIASGLLVWQQSQKSVAYCDADGHRLAPDGSVKGIVQSADELRTVRRPRRNRTLRALLGFSDQ
jgi:hypothetical protein